MNYWDVLDRALVPSVLGGVLVGFVAAFFGSLITRRR
jgi:hypothetical protein